MAKSVSPKNDGSDLLRILAMDGFAPTIPYDQQVASHLRHLIRKKKIPAHAKLPSLRALAELWGTNHHTVWDALKGLSGEGLVVIRPVRGCFVAPPRRELRRVCLYHNGPPHWGESSFDFYAHLDIELNNRFALRAVEVAPYYDRRPYEKLHTVPDKLRIMASEGEIDAVIVTNIFPRHTPWLFRLEVPVASLMFKQPERRIEIDVKELVRKVVDLAVQSQRKTIGLIHRPTGISPKEQKADFLRVELERLAAAEGISVVCLDNFADDAPLRLLPWEQQSCELSEQLLASPTPPDLIFVYPDAYIRGVATALVKHHIEIPEKVMVVSYRNAESMIYIPFPMTWLTVKVEDFASALIEQIDRQIRGEKLFPTTIAIAIEQTVPLPILGAEAT